MHTRAELVSAEPALVSVGLSEQCSCTGGANVMSSEARNLFCRELAPTVGSRDGRAAARARARPHPVSRSPVLPLEMGLYLGLFPLATKPRNPPHVSSDMSSESHASSDDS